MSLFYRVKEIPESNMSNNHCGSFKMIYWVPNSVGTATDGDRAVYNRHGACPHGAHIIQIDILNN